MIAEIIEAPLSSPEQYEELRRQTGIGGSQLPPGAVLHVAGPASGGGWRIVNVWESRQAAAEWGQKVRAAREELGFEGEAKVTFFEVSTLER